jgi:outer membrane biosynthesis protein TonB
MKEEPPKLKKKASEPEEVKHPKIEPKIEPKPEPKAATKPIKKEKTEVKPEPEKQPAPLLDMDDLLGMGSQPANTGFGFDPEPIDQGGDDWAKMDIFGTTAKPPNNIAAGHLKEVMSSTTPGKNGTTGLSVKGHFFNKGNSLILGLEITTVSGIHNDFDLKLKRNPFGVNIENALRKIQIAPPG